MPSRTTLQIGIMKGRLETAIIVKEGWTEQLASSEGHGAYTGFPGLNQCDRDFAYPLSLLRV
jgi:hypothetical protein